jgi:hypothetical protein
MGSYILGTFKFYCRSQTFETHHSVVPARCCPRQSTWLTPRHRIRSCQVMTALSSRQFPLLTTLPAPDPPHSHCSSPAAAPQTTNPHLRRTNPLLRRTNPHLRRTNPLLRRMSSRSLSRMKSVYIAQRRCLLSCHHHDLRLQAPLILRTSFLNTFLSYLLTSQKEVSLLKMHVINVLFVVDAHLRWNRLLHLQTMFRCLPYFFFRNRPFGFLTLGVQNKVCTPLMRKVCVYILAISYTTWKERKIFRWGNANVSLSS